MWREKGCWGLKRGFGECLEWSWGGVDGGSWVPEKKKVLVKIGEGEVKKYFLLFLAPILQSVCK